MNAMKAISLTTAAVAVVICVCVVSSVSLDGVVNSDTTYDPSAGSNALAGAAESNTTVATVGNNPYTSLKAAFDDIGTKGDISITVELISDCTESEIITVPSGKNVTLNLNGHIVTNSVAKDRLFNVLSSSFTVNGTQRNSGMMIPDTNSDSYGFIKIAAPSIVTINGGEYKGSTDSGAFVKIIRNNQNDGSDSTVTFNNVVMESNGLFFDTHTLTTDAKITTLIVNGGHYTTDGKAFGTDTLYESPVIFNGVTVDAGSGPGIEMSGSYGTFKDCSFAVTGVYPIEFYMAAVAVSWAGTAIIEGGDYTSKYGSGLYIYSSGGTIIVNEGTISGGKSAICASSLGYKGAYANVAFKNGITEGAWLIGDSDDISAIVSGGTHTTDVTQYLAEGYKATQTGGSYVVNVNLDSISFSVENNRRGETIIQPVPSTKATIDDSKTEVEWTYEGQHYSDSVKIAPAQAGLYTATVTVYDENGTSGTATASYQFNNTHTVTLKYDGKEKTFTVLHNSTIANLPTPGKPHCSYIWTDADGSEFKSTDKVVRDLELTATLVMSDIEVSISYVRENGNVYIQATCTPSVNVTDMKSTWAINYGDPSSVDRVELTEISTHYRFEMNAKTSDGTLARAVWEDDLCKTTGSSTETIQTDSEKVSIVPSDISDTAIDQTIDFNMPDIAEDEKVTIAIKGTITDTSSTVDVSVQDITKNGQTWTDGMSAAVDVTVNNVKSGYSLEITVKVQIPDNYLGAVAYYYNEARSCLEKVDSSIDEETGLVTIYTDHNTSYTVQVLTTDSPDPVVPDDNDTDDGPIYDDDDDWYPDHQTVADNNKNDDSKTAVACAAAAVVAALMAAFLIIDSKKGR